MATIDPFEQLKKGRDTRQRNTVSEFYNANLRYYATKGQFAWGATSIVTTPINTMVGTINELMSAGELKSKFMELAGTSNLAKIYITGTSAEHMAVCFKPEAKSFQIDPNTIFDQSGGTSVANCKAGTAGPTAGTDCYFCIQ